MPETQAIEEAYEEAVDGQADNTDEAMVASASVLGVAETNFHSNFSELDESDFASD